MEYGNTATWFTQKHAIKDVKIRRMKIRKLYTDICYQTKSIKVKLPSLIHRCTQSTRIHTQSTRIPILNSTTPLLSSYWMTSSNGKKSALLALCPVPGSFDVLNILRLNKRLSKQSRRRWFQTPSHSLWRHCNGGVLSKWNESSRRRKLSAEMVYI